LPHTVSVHAKAVLLGGAGFLSFLAGGLIDLPKPWGFALIVTGLGLAALAGTLKCPNCGHRVTSRPWRLFGVPTTSSAGVSHLHCHFCGYDLRELLPPQ
jgi:hypothetical protein